MDHNHPPKRLRAAASTACHPCRVAKKRCEGGTPCLSCRRRGTPCTRPSENDLSDGHHKGLAVGDHIGTATSGQKYMLDIHPALYDLTAGLLDRYFHFIAPVWPLVKASDLDCRPFPSPLLIRSICLLSAMSFPEMDSTLLRTVTESIHQCLAVGDLLSSPSLPTLQALLLLLACPHFTQRSIMIASVIRMASILGLNRPDPKRPIIHWTCIAWARWEAVKSKHENQVTHHTPHFLSPFEPDKNSFFGRIYHLLADAQNQKRSTSSSPESDTPNIPILTIPEAYFGLTGTTPADDLSSITKYEADFDYFLQILEGYLLADPAGWKGLQLEIPQQDQSPWFRFHPFHDILQQSRNEAE